MSEEYPLKKCEHGLHLYCEKCSESKDKLIAELRGSLSKSLNHLGNMLTYTKDSSKGVIANPFDDYHQHKQRAIDFYMNHKSESSPSNAGDDGLGKYFERYDEILDRVHGFTIHKDFCEVGSGDCNCGLADAGCEQRELVAEIKRMRGGHD